MELFTTLLVERNTCLTQESNRYATIVKYFNMLKFEKKMIEIHMRIYIVITIISYTTTDPVNKPQWLKTKPKHQKKKTPTKKQNKTQNTIQTTNKTTNKQILR